MTNSVEDVAFEDGFRGVSQADLESMSDGALADWQANRQTGTALSILGEREWQRRLMVKQLREQFDLNSRLAEASERANRFTMLCVVAATIVGAIIGGGATLIGAKMQQAPLPSLASPSSISQPKIAPTVLPPPPAK
jgi:hypothetical protein